jgi:hypothetical protein
MATQSIISAFDLHGKQKTVWSTMLNGDVGQAAENETNADGMNSMQVTGTFGASGSIQAEGSNDGTNWFVLHDLLGAAITFTATGLKTIREYCAFIRPHVTAGDGTTSLTVVMISRHIQ